MNKLEYCRLEIPKDMTYEEWSKELEKLPPSPGKPIIEEIRDCIKLLEDKYAVKPNAFSQTLQSHDE